VTVVRRRLALALEPTAVFATPRPMRYLITGGAGFIGSHVTEALLARGERVVVLDDLSTGRRANLDGVVDLPGFSLVEGSVADRELVRGLVADCDHVIHLAAAVGVRKIMAERVAGIRTNVEGSENVLAACAESGRPLFFASTSEVYGKNAKVPFSEDDDSVLGASSLHRWSYACAKLLDEFLALAWFHEHRLPVTVARFFNVTGPRQCPDYGMVLPRFCAAALAGDELTVHGTGQQSRCFLHVADAVSAVLALLECPAAVGQVVNIGSDEETTIRALAERVIAAVGSASRIHTIPYAAAFPEGGFEDMQRRVPATAKLVRLTGWTRQHDLAATVRDALGWARRD
jgi:UDP-glucose 4-epimerase